MLKSSIKVNEYQRLKVITKLQHELKVLKGKTIGILGLTFKPDTNDLRDAPSLDIIAKLQELGCKVKGYDPMYSYIQHDSRLAGVILAKSVDKLAQDCHALVLVTDWQEFLEVDYAKIIHLVANPLFIDGRNFLDKQKMKDLGFKYVGIGR
jgi:UDPglucose 6-dehydrogenase